MKAKVTLINFTPEPIETMCWARRVMHAPVPNSLREIKKNPKKWLGMSINKYFNKVLLNDGMPTFLEYINLAFKLENVSRALTHQLVRHRIGFSYSQQSMRCISVKNFANKKAYHLPKGQGKRYEKKMKKIQEIYNQAISEGVSIQDARGLLPMNIYTTITFSCSLRALIGMINKRLCFKVQGEFKEIANLLIKELNKKVDKRIMKWIGPPCKINKYCIMKGENEQQLKQKKFSGKQNTEYVCPLYLKNL